MRYSTPFVWKRGKVCLNRRMIAAYHHQGVPESMFRQWITLVFPINSVKHQILVARAYDNAHGTRTCEGYPDVTDLPIFDVVG